MKSNTTNNNSNNNNNGNSKSSNSNHNAVADYFAVLGIGESLQLKSKKKIYQESVDESSDGDRRGNGNADADADGASNSIPDDADTGNDPTMSSSSSSNIKKQQSLQEQEEECLMMQKFYREIVDLAILSVYTGSVVPLSTRPYGDSNAPVNNTNTNNGNGPPVTAAQLATSRCQCTYSDMNMSTNNNFNDKNDNDKNDNDNEKSSSTDSSSQQELELPIFAIRRKSKPQEVDGYQIIYETVPPNPFTLKSDAQSQDMTLSNLSINMSLSINTTNTNLDLNRSLSNLQCQNQQTTLWNKGQTYAADLHPITGYRATLLSNLHQQTSLLQTTNTTQQSHDPNSSILFNNHSADNHSSSHQHQAFSNSFDTDQAIPSEEKRFLPRFATPTISKLKQHISPILASATKVKVKATDDDETFHSNGRGFQYHPEAHVSQRETHADAKIEMSSSVRTAYIPIRKKEYYIGYRRREPDEINKPGVAECTILYCRIHKESILVDKCDLGRRLGIPYRSSSSRDNGCHKDNGINGGSFSLNNVDNADIDDSAGAGAARSNGNSVQPSGMVSRTAKLRRGLVTGAGLAKKVASHGRDKIRMVAGGAVTSANTSTSAETNTATATATTGDENNDGNLHVRDPQGTAGRMDDQYSHNYDHTTSTNVPSHSNSTDDESWMRPHHLTKDQHSRQPPSLQFDKVKLEHILDLPQGYDEWVIPEMYQTIRLPIPPSPSRSPLRKRTNERNQSHSPYSSYSPRRHARQNQDLAQAQGESTGEKRMQKTFLFNNHSDRSMSKTIGDAGIGVEAFVDSKTFLHTSHNMPKANTSSPGKGKRNPWSPVELPPNGIQPGSSFLYSEENVSGVGQEDEENLHREAMMPLLVECDELPRIYDPMDSGDGDYEFVPLVALRRQRFSEEERFHEDPSMIDVAMSFTGLEGKPVLPLEEEDEFEESQNDDEDPFSGRSTWGPSNDVLELDTNEEDAEYEEAPNEEDVLAFGMPSIVCKRNLPMGFLDTPFATQVLDRFPKKDYKGVPLPEEELPMFCYPTGCKLFRARYQDAPLPENYGFIVKNERGDSIHVSCVSFMEPLGRSKLDQLNEMSRARRLSSLPHKLYCERQDRAKTEMNDEEDKSSLMVGFEEIRNGESALQEDDMLLTGFDEMMTFENKTICLISRYPFWSAFRRFLSHLHILSGSSSDLPLERYISHLLLTVPAPKPGGQCILIPLPAIASPMVLGLPALKDLPVLDLSFRRLFSCLDVPTVVTIVLGFLVLERKVIIMSAYPSLVSDACELLRSLLFPFELCAPYVPRLTEPFMSCLNFPGAIFAGIHDDGSTKGLASTVRRDIPEDTFIVDLDTGDIDCNGDRFEILKDCWDIIPSQIRSLLVEEIEALCQDGNIEPGQEPTGAEIEAALDMADVSFAPIFDENDTAMIDDRAIRDTFLRFFCLVLGGYERFLLVPDIDFLVSGNEWFDTKGFLAATEKQSRGIFLQAFVSTQLFQSFIQRRTEASDVHCLLFDECLNEYHSTQEPYGRLIESAEVTNSKGSLPRYELLVDQCAAELCNVPEVDESSSADNSILTAHTTEGFMINNSGDLVTAPSKRNLPPGNRYVYCIDGHSHFPQDLDTEMFYPEEPDVLSAEFDKIPVPTLTRSDREIDDSNRRRRLAISHRGVQRQRRCLFQLPKLMASHVFNAWLMCIPSQVSQQFQNTGQQSTYLLRALGALRLLRSKHRIVPDEAGYRCLIIACGRVDSDRRQDVVKLFGLLRSDGIFPSAVTLGQYTRAIAEGYSKQSTGNTNSIISDFMGYPGSPLNADNSEEKFLNLQVPNTLDFLDGSLVELDEVGSHWRQGRDARRKEVANMKSETDTHDQSTQPRVQHTKRRTDKEWIPVSGSSSFSPHWKPPKSFDETFDLCRDFRFIALWSRATACGKCNHVLLDEEIQAGWDDDSSDGIDESLNEIKCPCCTTLVKPRIGYVEMPPHTPDVAKSRMGTKADLTNEHLPAQVQNKLSSDQSEANDERLGYVPYVSPSKMRSLLENIIEDFGEDILEREKLRYLNPTIFFNLWWFCCRFSLPFPLVISNDSLDDGVPVYNNHCCAFAAWDKSIALAACHSAAKGVSTLQHIIRKKNRPKAAVEFQNLVKSFQGQSNDDLDQIDAEEVAAMTKSLLKTDYPLLANLNLQAIGQGDWDNADLSTILVKLVEACDKRDFYPAIEAVLQCNNDRRAKFGRDENVELDCYRTLLYLTRYQCTSAFHKFFPTTSKTCKGYHFWCPNATVSIFDRMFREALDRVRAQGNITPVPDVSDIALGFRSVFGHII